MRDPDGRFEYRGGTLPVADAPSMTARCEPAVESIPGLRGFVGVDFIWDERRGACDRPGDQSAADDVDRRALTRLLPPGRLAAAWLGAFEPRAGGRRAAGAVCADLVHSADPVVVRCVG